MVTDETVDRALELIEKGAGNYEYFFAKLSSPAWIEPLSRRGRFSHPPPGERIDNFIRFPRWPEGEYLLRMAPQAPEQVAAAIERVCFESENPTVHELLLEIASVLPTTLARDIAAGEAAWVKQRAFLLTLYPEKAARLIVHLSTGGEPGVALELATALLDVREKNQTKAAPGAGSEEDDSSSWKPSPVPIGKIEPWYAQRLLMRVTEPLLATVPNKFLKAVAANLNRAVTIHCSNQGDDREDYSTIWRPHLAYSSHYETLDECVSAVTNAIKLLGKSDADNSAMIMTALAPYKWPIFDRLRAFVYLESAHPDPTAVAKFLSDGERYRGSPYNSEFQELLKKWSTSLPKESIQTILGIIDAGPDPASYAYHLEHRVRPEDVDKERAGIIERWQLSWLLPLEEALDPTRRDELNGLLKKYHAPEPRFTSGLMQLTDHSPMDLDAVKKMSVEEMLKYLKEWSPVSSGLPWDQPSRAGMGNTLKEWVADDPQHVSDIIDVFLTKELPPIYVTSLIDAFSSALKGSKPFDVYAVARAVQWVCENTERDESAAKHFPDDANWNWAHMSGARFMSELFLEEKRLNLSKAGDLFHAVRALCFVPSPRVEDEAEYKKDASRFVPLALNSPRPVGVEALIRYGRWLKLATPEAEFQRDQLRPVFDVLEQKLDPKQDPSVAVREMFGMHFRILAWLDQGWFESMIPKLFPGKAEKILDRFAWNAYLQFGGPLRATFPAMRKRYDAAVMVLQKGEAKVSALDRILANHLMHYYAQGALELDDDLLVQFFERASGPQRAQAIGDIGWHLGQENTQLSAVIQERLMRLWESRLALAATDAKQVAVEITRFGWWLGSKKFPDDWAVNQAMRVLEVTRALHPDFAVIETFAQFALRFPYEAVHAARILFEEDREGWAIHGWGEHLRNILVEALNDGEKARKEATETIELLVSKGHRGYRSLLKSES